jgi:hypothetical protein
MPVSPKAKPRHAGRSLWPVLFFIAFFALGLAGVCKWYLLPAMDAFNGADDKGRRVLAAHALLMMSILLIMLVLLLMLTFRMGRMFFPSPMVPRTKTKYVDAWAEAGKRLQEKKEDDHL